MLKHIIVFIFIFCGLKAECQSLANNRIDTLYLKDTSDILALLRDNLEQYRTNLNVLASLENPRERQRGINNLKDDREIFVPNAKLIDDLDPQADENDHTTYTFLKMDQYLGRFISRYHDASQNSIHYTNFRTPCFWCDSIKDINTQKYSYRYFVGIAFVEAFSGKDYSGRNFLPHNIFATLEIDYNRGWNARIREFTFCPSTVCCREIKNQIPIASNIRIRPLMDTSASLYKLYLRKGDSILRMVNTGNWDKNCPIAWAYLSQAALHPTCAAQAKLLLNLTKEKIEEYNPDFNNIIYQGLKSHGNELENNQKYKDAYIMYEWAYRVKADNLLSLRMGALSNKIREIEKLESNGNADEAISGLRRLITANGENANPDVWYALAKRYMEKCDPRAQIAFDKTHSLDKENYEAYRVEGDYYENCPCHNYRKASEAYDLYINTFPDTNSITFKAYQYRKKYCYAMALFMDSKYELAKTAFVDAMKIDQTPEARCYNILCYVFLNKNDAQNTIACRDIKNLLDSNRKNPGLNYWYGNLLYKKKHGTSKLADSAIDYIKEALILQPKNNIWKMDLAYKYLLKADAAEERGEKIQSYSSAVALYKSILEDVYINKNECHNKLAQCEYKWSLLSDESSNEAAKLLSDSKNNMDTLSGENLYKDDTNYMKMYAFVFLSLKNYDSAIICFQKASQNDPEVHFGLGIANYLSSRNISSCIKEIELSFKRNISYELVNDRFKYCHINDEKHT